MAILAACSAVQPTPTPAPTQTPVPAVPTATLRPAVPPTSVTAPTPSPGPQAPATVDPSSVDPIDLQNAFLTNVDDLIAEASDLSSTPCDDLTNVTRSNPSLVPSIRGFAAALKRTAGSQPILDTDDVKAAMSDLDKSLGELDGALGLCGIRQP